VFLGTHFPKLDDKGRLFLPAKFRDELADGLVITRGQERSLSVWPEREFVPPMLRDYAGLDRDCVVIGAMNRVEIWNTENWNRYSQEQEQAFADLSEEVLPGIF